MFQKHRTWKTNPKDTKESQILVYNYGITNILITWYVRLEITLFYSYVIWNIDAERKK